MSEVTNTDVSLNMKNEHEKPNQKNAQSILQIKRRPLSQTKPIPFFGTSKLPMSFKWLKHNLGKKLCLNWVIYTLFEGF
jgi:hypothetical protein